MKDELLRYKIALTFIKGLGPASTRLLVAYCGGIKEIFETPIKSLCENQLPKSGIRLLQSIRGQDPFKEVDKVLLALEKHKIQPVFYLDLEYPARLNHCSDAPVLLYKRGSSDLNHPYVLSIVGTRNASRDAIAFCKKLVEELAIFRPLIISGLAHGVDVCAHRAALDNDLNTIAVLGHGLDRIYPAAHRNVARSIIQKGALLTEYRTDTDAIASNFPERNRIIAGMSDATVVIESAKKGGSMITANLANGYNRDVFAVPGKPDDQRVEGCNHLIKTNQAHLITCAEDIAYVLGWKQENKRSGIQRNLFVTLDESSRSVISLLEAQGALHVDEIATRTRLSTSQVNAIILNLEFNGLIRNQPGNIYNIA